jgi:PAS domain S-box-containing protein
MTTKPTPDEVTERDDLAELRRRADLLARAEMTERKFSRVFEFAPDAMLLVREDGTIDAANLQAGLLLGVPYHDLVGRSVDSIVPNRFRDVHGAHRGSYISDPTPRLMGRGRGRFQALRADGSEFTCEIALAPLYGELGVLVIATIRDISLRPSV